ncbi:MAG: hypothetical protein U0996_03150 [Planctomycetaceae bacterium]
MARLCNSCGPIVFSILSVVVLSETSSLPAQEIPSPEVFAGVVCDSFATSDVIQLVSDLESEFGFRSNDLSEEIRRSIRKRFADRIQVPYAKGCVLVSQGELIEYWYFEECFTVDGARALVEDFSKQWKSAEETKRPNYQVETNSPADNQWSVNISNLLWSSKIVKSTPEEKEKTGEDFQIVWTSQKSRSTSRHRFRYQNGWLWSAYSDSLFQPTLLPDVAEHTSAKDASRRRLGRVWFSPQKLSVATKAHWDTAIATAIGTVAQQNDGQSVQQAVTKKGLHDAALAMVRTILNDMETASAELFVDEQQVVLEGRISVRSESQAEQYLRKAELPQTPVPNSSTSGVSFVAATRLPPNVLSAFDHQKADPDRDLDLICAGEFVGTSPYALQGIVSATGEQPARLLRIISSLAPELTLAEPITVRGIPMRVIMSENTNKTALEITIKGENADESAVPSTNVVEYGGRGSLLAFRVSENILRSSDWLLQPKPRPSENQESGAAIQGDFSADRHGLTAKITCRLSAARKILASILLQRQ